MFNFSAVTSYRDQKPHKVVQLVIAGLFMLSLQSCSLSSGPEPALGLNFEDLKPYLVDVAAVEVVEEYTSRFDDPFVEHLSPVTPIQGLREWVTARFRAVGSVGTLRIIVTDAGIIGKSLDTNRDFKALFISEQGAEFMGTVSVTIDVLDAQGISLAHVSVHASASKTLAEDASLRDRDYAMFSLTESLLKAFSREASRQINQYFNLFLR